MVQATATLVPVCLPFPSSHDGKLNSFASIGYVQACQFIARTKYYGIWTLTEGAAILTGFGFTGYTPSGKSTWHGAANLDVMNVEFAPNFKVLLDSWNMKTNTWLRECIYKRVTPKGKKPGFMSSMLTFGTSAFWVCLVSLICLA